MNFLVNKYSKWYYSIIYNARQRGYGEETHHIIPRSLGGDNQPQNLVRLTLKEHFICHWLLCHMQPNRLSYEKMCRAFLAMSTLHDGRRVSCSRFFSYSKKIYSKSRHGGKLSEEHRQKISEANKRLGRWQGNDNPGRKLTVHPRKGKQGTFLGRKHTEETKLLLRQNNIMKRDPYAAARVRWTKEARQKQSEETTERNRKQWRIQDPNGHIIVVNDLKGWCSLNQFNYHSLMTMRNRGKPYKGFHITEIQSLPSGSGRHH